MAVSTSSSTTRTAGHPFAVIDLETTGLSNHDRVVEIAIIGLDHRGYPIDEWDTLVDPGRDVGPTWLHGVSAAMVGMAPIFEDVAGAIQERLHGAVLVAHNAPFDLRFLQREFERLDCPIDAGVAIDTLAITRRKLGDACADNGITISNAHRAIADARATAELFLRVGGLDHTDGVAPAQMNHRRPRRGRTLRREAFDSGDPIPPPPYLGALAAHLHHTTVDTAVLSYIEMLDWALADLVLAPNEHRALSDLARDLKLTDTQVRSAHEIYRDELIEAALRDGVVTDDEMTDIERASITLGVDTSDLHRMLNKYRPPAAQPPATLSGARVCFTGEASDPRSPTNVSRSRLRELAHRSGMIPVDSPTKKGCDLLVAADPASQSGKATKARRYGIPVISVTEFLQSVGEVQ